MAPSLEEFEAFERACVVTACGASPLHPSQLVHSQSSTARHSAYCARYRTRDGDGLALPAFCKLTVMAIAAESCHALRPAYKSMFRQMLVDGHAEVDVPGDADCDRSSLHTAQTPEPVSLNSVVLDMGLGHFAPGDRAIVKLALRVVEQYRVNGQ
jgi:hypothetical protein